MWSGPQQGGPCLELSEFIFKCQKIVQFYPQLPSTYFYIICSYLCILELAPYTFRF